MTHAINSTPTTSQSPPPDFFYPMFVMLALVGFAFYIATVGLNFKAAQWIAKREQLSWIFGLSVLNLLNQPFGLALGIYTFMILTKPEVKAQFAARP